ncbi:hypothetical protein HBB16_10790 [Pseudonocardia sp. MCCB 268]|nr:hypothetical protein [Pseudonocardia cytotoxica]
MLRETPHPAGDRAGVQVPGRRDGVVEREPTRSQQRIVRPVGSGAREAVCCRRRAG